MKDGLFIKQHQLLEKSSNFLNTNQDLSGSKSISLELLERVNEIEQENFVLKQQLKNAETKLAQLISHPGSSNQVHSNGEVANTSSSQLAFSKSLAVSNGVYSGPKILKCELIQVAIVCAGYNSSRSVVTLIKSILFYRKQPLHFHFIVDTTANLILSTLFKTWAIPNVQVSFYLASNYERDVNWIPNKHYSGIFGLMKLILPRILPSTLNQVIVLDTDITFSTDIAELWQLFQTGMQSDSKVMIGIVENQSDWYLGKLWKNHQTWPAIGRGYNTGVMLLRLDRMRKFNWNAIWRMVAEKELMSMLSTALADQDVFNAVIKQYPQVK